MATLDLVLGRFIDLIPPAREQGIIQIYKAFHVHRCTDVLLKVVSGVTSIDEVSALIEAQNRICLEAQATQRVNHPNVVRVIDASTGPTLNTFVALEFLEGRNLAQLLEVAAPMSVPHMLEIAIPVASAIDAAHRAGIIHGDIKPANVMVVDEGPKLVDFGCASSPLLTGYRPMGKATGTYAYMCPSYRQTAILSERSDIFSFGILLYEMLAGFNPFADDARAHVSETFVKRRPSQRGQKRLVPPLDQVAPAVPLELAREIHRAIARDPDARHSSMAELLSVLQEQRRTIDSIEPVRHGVAIDDKYATAGCGVAAMARAIDSLAEEHSPPVHTGSGTGFGAGFFSGSARPRALQPARSTPAPMATETRASVEKVLAAAANRAHPLLKLKAQSEAETVPGVDVKGIALSAATFSTLGWGTAARPTVTHARVQSAAELTGPDTLPFASCPDGISPASRQSLAGGRTLDALRITIDPAAAIQSALAVEADPTPPDAAARVLYAATPTPVRAIAAEPRAGKATFRTPTCGTMTRSPAPFRASALSAAVAGPDTQPMGTLIICSPRRAAPSHLAVAHKQELEATVQPAVALGESARVAGNTAVRVTPANQVASQVSSRPPAHQLALVSGGSWRTAGLYSKAVAKDTRVYAGVPVRRPAMNGMPFAEILSPDSRSNTRMAKTLGMVAFAASLLIGFSSMHKTPFPGVQATTAEETTVEIIPRQSEPSTEAASQVRPLLPEALSGHASPEVAQAPAADTRTGSESIAASPTAPLAKARHVGSGASGGARKKVLCGSGRYSDDCVPSLPPQFPSKRKQPDSAAQGVPMPPDASGIIDPWAPASASPNSRIQSPKLSTVRYRM